MSVMVGPIVLSAALPGAGGRPFEEGVRRPGAARHAAATVGAVPGTGAPRAAREPGSRAPRAGSPATPCPSWCRPCSPRPARCPTAATGSVEFAWEGLRCLAHVRPDRVRLRTVNGRDVTSSFPELVEPLTRRAPRGGMVLDGTVVAVGEGGLPRRRLLQRRTAATRPSAAVLRRTPVGFIVGDLLWLAGRDLVDLPYRRRRELLEELGLDRPPVVVSPTFPVTEAAAVMRTAEEYGAEALHARHLDAPYRPGRRPRSWLRVPAAPVRPGGRRRLDAGGPARAGPGRRAAARRARPRSRPRAALRRPGRDRRGGGAAGGRGAAGPAAPGRLAVRRAAARRRRPATRSGSSPAWSGGSSSPTGRRTGGCGCPRGAGSSTADRAVDADRTAWAAAPPAARRPGTPARRRVRRPPPTAAAPGRGRAGTGAGQRAGARRVRRSRPGASSSTSSTTR